MPFDLSCGEGVDGVQSWNVEGDCRFLELREDDALELHVVQDVGDRVPINVLDASVFINADDQVCKNTKPRQADAPSPSFKL